MYKISKYCYEFEPILWSSSEIKQLKRAYKKYETNWEKIQKKYFTDKTVFDVKRAALIYLFKPKDYNYEVLEYMDDSYLNDEIEHYIKNKKSVFHSFDPLLLNDEKSLQTKNKNSDLKGKESNQHMLHNFFNKTELSGKIKPKKKNVNKYTSIWTKEEVQVLTRAYNMIGNQWKFIQHEYFPNKNTIDIRNKALHLQRVSDKSVFEHERNYHEDDYFRLLLEQKQNESFLKHDDEEHEFYEHISVGSDLDEEELKQKAEAYINR